MTSEEKRVYLLLKAVIFYYHGLDPEEKVDLEGVADRLSASEELKWAVDFNESIFSSGSESKYFEFIKILFKK
jgi:hypothetical protein